MNARLSRAAAHPASAPHARPHKLQRKCACGATATNGETCEACKAKRVQTKLAVGATDDPLEREADRIAEQVTDASGPGAPGAAPPGVQRAANDASAHAGGQSSPASVERALAGAGQPLEPAVRRDMEQRFGHDFFDVRVHADADAHRSAHDVNALAYTAGRHIVFAAHRYAPGTHEGRRLLAHELAHVVQQRAATPVVRAAPKGKGGGKPPKAAVPQVCGRDSRKVKDNWITKVNVDVGSNQLSIEWNDPAKEPALSKSNGGKHDISPGAGKCCVDCNDEKTSQTSGSLCTPKGDTWKVFDTGCALAGHPSAKNPSYFQRSGIAIHSGNTSSPPQSHGCSRTSVGISELIHDNVVVKKTDIAVSGTWAGTRCYMTESTDTLSNRKDVCDGTSVKKEQKPKKKKKAGAPARKAALEPGDGAAPDLLAGGPEPDDDAPEPASALDGDGPGPNNEPASEEAADTPELADAAPDADQPANEDGSAPAVQAKLAVGSVDDPLEREADRIADRVIASSAPDAASDAAGDAPVSDAPVSVQRASGNGTGAIRSAPPSVGRALASGGRPLEPAVRRDMERGFGHGFLDVRVHDDAHAHRSARDVGAQAYTSGRHVVFAAGRYAPGTRAGRHLIAHELAHVLQQRNSGSPVVRRSLDGCADLLRAPSVSAVPGSAVHRALAAHFSTTVAGARGVAIPGASAAPLRSQALCGGDDKIIDPQITGGASGTGFPDLARQTPAGVLQVAEIKPAHVNCLVDGEEQELRYIDQGNARDPQQTAWRAAQGIRVVTPMPESAYSPPQMTLSVPGVTVELRTAWCTAGLLAYSLRTSGQPVPVPVPQVRRDTERERLRVSVPSPVAVGAGAVAVGVAAVAGRALWPHFWRVVATRFALRGALAAALSAADGPLPFGELISLGMAIVTVVQIVNDWNDIWRDADRLAAGEAT